MEEEFPLIGGTANPQVSNNENKITANPQVSENKNNLINVEEATSISEQLFFQTMTNSVEEIEKGFKETSTCGDVNAMLEKYQACITPAWELINSPTESIAYLWDMFLPLGDLCLIYGDSGDFKSTLMRSILFAIAYGMDEYLGFKIDLTDEQRKVCLVITEDSPNSIKSLLQKQSKYFEQFRTIENPIFDVVHSCENGIIHTLQERMKDISYSAIVVDTPQDDLGDMNSNSIVRNYLNQLSTLGVKYNCTVIPIHHKRKYTLDKAPSKEDLSGTRAFYDKPRSVFELRRHPDKDYVVYLTPVKSNFQDNEFLKYSYVLYVDPETLTFSSKGEKVLSSEIHILSEKKIETQSIEDKIIAYKLSNPKITQIQIVELLREEFPNRKINQPQVCNILKGLKAQK